jgi:glycosyltransferase involved in cell wall biosynthesis
VNERTRNLLYISDGYVELSVFASQVHTLCNVEADMYNVSVIALCGSRELKSPILEPKKYDLIRTFRFPKSFIPMMNSFSRRNFLRQYGADLFRKADIIHSRGHVSSAMAIRILEQEKLSKPLIADIRGELPEEVRITGKKLGGIFYRQARTLERFVFERANYFFFVSSALKEYYSAMYGLKPNQSSVFPTMVNDDLFFRDVRLREEMRKKLNLENTYTYVYVGGSDVWQNLDKILKRFAETRTSTRRTHLILIVKRPEPVRELLKQFGLTANDATLVSLPYHEVPDYLRAADAGIIIRDDHIINRVASPTKINEYLACGLKIIDRLDDIGKTEIPENPKYRYMPMNDIIEGHRRIYNELIADDNTT